MGDSSELGAALARADGTVTTFLEQLVGEPIDAHQRRHQTTPAPPSNHLRVAPGEPLLHRTAVLRGRTSGRPYVAAQTVLVISRLPRIIHQRLEAGSDPIGRLFEQEGVAFTRDPIAPPDWPRSVLAMADVAIDECLLARSYRADVDGIPVMTLTEWFLSALSDYFADH